MGLVTPLGLDKCGLISPKGLRTDRREDLKEILGAIEGLVGMNTSTEYKHFRCGWGAEGGGPS